MVFKLTSSLLVFGLLFIQSNGQQGLSLEDLINQVFTPTPSQGTTQVFTPTPAPTPAPTPDTRVNANGGAGAYKSCGLDKECVPRHLCVDGAISTTGENFIDIRIDSTCAYNELCCDLPNKRSEPVIPPLPPVLHGGCGWRNKDGVGYRVIGDNDHESQFGEFPWMVAILRTEDAAGEIIHLYDCGGSLIAANVVLTASHCVINREANQLVVRGGEWDTQNTNEILPHVDKRVREIIRHEKYNKGALYNDVALLILEDPFNWQENIRPICLPEPNTNFDRSRCYATGWGKDKFSRDGEYQVILKKIDLPIVPQDTCQQQLRQTRLGLYFNLHESFVCAGGEKGKDTCKGDGGSPLVCPVPGSPDRFYQVGIVAWGVGCAEENIPGVYANIPHLRPWISEKLSARGIPFADFTP
ncbi:phenoloxidase-activating factor 2 isoform X2 [Stomoxys calcitrans]|uniref:Phenoloxidase-activating factor 2 n=2 Tax=Stomoxys calcitrans TaxID=35570 RepID=A0A1I8P8M5_STOCA|nr:phenoloxidase-activating factor 2 isoform X2 [Stomoxys calcitrans]